MCTAGRPQKRVGSGSSNMFNKDNVTLLRQRRDSIREWLDEEAPYTDVDQRHLDAHTPEQAYWHLGYHRGLSDMLSFLKEQAEDSEGTASPSHADGQDE